MIVLLPERIINIFDSVMFKQAQTETLYAEEKSPCIVLGTRFAKVKTNSQLLLDSRKGRWNPLLPPAEGRGGPCQQLCQVPAVPVGTGPAWGTSTPQPLQVTQHSLCSALSIACAGNSTRLHNAWVSSSLRM